MRINHITGPQIVTKLNWIVQKTKNPGFYQLDKPHLYYEIINVTRGQMQIVTNGISVQLKTGDSFFIPKNTAHKLCCIGETPLMYLNIGYRGILPNELSNKVNHGNIMVRDTLLRLNNLRLPPMNTLKAELGACILTEFILRSWMQITAKGLLQPDVPINRYRYYSDLVNQTLEVINERYSEELRLEQISKAVGATTSCIRNLLKKETGYGFIHHLQAVRVEAAKELLYSGNENINSIANKVGYSSLPAFFKVFRRFTEMTPLEFAKTTASPLNLISED